MNTIASLKECLKNVPDFRKAKGLQYALSDVLSLLIIGLICNANDCVALSNFVSSKKKQLSKYFHFPFEKTPSHDLFIKVLENIDSKAFSKAILLWLEGEKVENFSGKQVSIDGKALIATRPSGSSPRGALQVVSAWLSEESISIGQVFAKGKASELKMIPFLLQELDLEGTIVTIDAIATNPVIGNQIVEQGGDYILPLKKTIKTSIRK